MIRTFYHICLNCEMCYGDHTDNKCMYESTWFQPVACFVCGSDENPLYTTALVSNVRYYMCRPCADILHKEGKLPKTANLKAHEFLPAYFMHDIYVVDWLRDAR